MGRTNPTFRDVVDAYRRRWRKYRRGLRRRDQEHFDQLLDYVEEHADASSYMNADDPVTPIMLSMHLEQEKRIEKLESRIEDLENDSAE